MSVERSIQLLRSATDETASGWPAGWRVSDLSWSVLATLAYADIFDFPMSPDEILHYLIGHEAALAGVRRALDEDARLRNRIERRDGLYCLAGRPALVDRRRQREEIARRLWPAAVRHAASIAALPFVRMVAVTGALALDNNDGSGDIDYLVVTVPGRLWLARAMVVLLVRRAALEGVTLCPNYVLSEDALHLPDRDLFSAHEVAQMIPLAGQETYWRMRRLNRGWVGVYLPNAGGLPPHRAAALQDGRARLRRAERVLGSSAFDPLERWEASRKIRRFRSEAKARGGPAGASGSAEERFSDEWCKGHFDHHAGRTMAAFAKRLEEFGEGWR